MNTAAVEYLKDGFALEGIEEQACSALTVPDVIDAGVEERKHSSPALRIGVTIFRDAYAQTAEYFSLEIDNLAEKIADPVQYDTKQEMGWIKLARFGDKRSDKNSLRHDSNVVVVTGCEGDYDAEQVSLNQATALCEQVGIRALFYTSPSNTPDKPRWRVLAPFSREHPPVERRRFIARLNGALGGILAPESFVLSQSYYIGQVIGAPYSWAQSHGEFIDRRDDLDARAIDGGRNGTSRAERLRAIRGDDPVLRRLADLNRVIRERNDGGADIACPFEGEHTSQGGNGDCVYWPANTGGFAHGHFKCLHGHCANRSDADFLTALGLAAHTVGMRDASALSILASIATDTASPADDSWPDPSPIPDALPPVEPFDYDMLPDSLRGWVKDIAERVQCPADFPAVGAMISLATVVGRKIGIRPKRQDDWLEVPNLWGAVIGRPGDMKSPALREAMRPLRNIEQKALESFDGAFAEWQQRHELTKLRRDAEKINIRKAFLKGNAIDPDALTDEIDEEPHARRYVVNDCSVEALGEILRYNQNGILAYRDELIGLLKSLDKEGNEGARGFFLSAWSGTDGYTFDRIGRGLNLRIEACCLSLLGSIQPAIIGGYLRQAVAGGGADGLLSRFQLLVWPDVAGEWRNVDRWPNTETKAAAHDTFERLDTLDPSAVGASIEDGAIPYLRFDDAAQELFTEWRAEFERRIRSGDDHAAFEAHLAKYRKLVPVLALLIHLADDGNGAVGETALLKALAWAEYLESHARRAYASVMQAESESARALLQRIRRGDVPDPFVPRDVYLKHRAYLSTPEETYQAVRLLVDLDWLREERQETGGRPKVLYRINPKAKPS